MRKEILEETIRVEIEKQAEQFGVNFNNLSPNAQSWLRSLVTEQLYRRESAVVVTPETAEEE